MNTRFYIAAALLVFFSAPAQAQFGHVVVHSDPRLAVLLKKNPVAAPPPTPVPNADAKRNAKQGSGAPGESPEPLNVNEEAPRHFVPPPSHRDGAVIYSGKGFRVQIYNGYDRDKAIKVRAEFMRTDPDTRAYFSYVAPSFRVKIGDYRTREQAAKKLHEVKSNYATPCMIVPDMITVHAN